jgi:hypothetical protein
MGFDRRDRYRPIFADVSHAFARVHFFVIDFVILVLVDLGSESLRHATDFAAL